MYVAIASRPLATTAPCAGQGDTYSRSMSVFSVLSAWILDEGEVEPKCSNPGLERERAAPNLERSNPVTNIFRFIAYKPITKE
jgi:hypothetical protein